MRQTTLCVPLEVKPESCSRLSALIEQLKATADGDPDDNFRVVRDGVPALHFMSMSVFPDADYDPLFILEANFDGAPGPFWRQLEALFGEELRGIIRCCKKPLTRDGALYDAVTRPRSTVPVAGYLEARTQLPSVFHHGNRGLSRDRILGEHALFLSAKQELTRPAQASPGQPNVYRTGTPQDVHRLLRETLTRQQAFSWLGHAAPARISLADRIGDIGRLAVFAILLLLALSLPGLVLASIFKNEAFWLVLAIVAGLVGMKLYADRDPPKGAEVVNRRSLPIVQMLGLAALAIGLYLLAVLVVLAPALLAIESSPGLQNLLGMEQQPTRDGLIGSAVRIILLGLASAVLLVLPLLILILRRNEKRDSSNDAPHLDERVLQEIARREDWVTQNHMGSIVLIKPGILRSIIIRAGHLGLGLFLRVKATDGYLGSMRTVHFAHWAFLNNGSRLLFFSNFDHSWGSYLDDFIEKAHTGLTLAWGCGVGFPQTRFLIKDGASHGRQFKAWALASRSVSRFWYSAYRDLTVDQIERNHRIASGLRKPILNATEAETWARDL